MSTITRRRIHTKPVSNWLRGKLEICEINRTVIATTATAIHHCLSAWNTGEFRVRPEFGPAGGAELKCNARNINHVGNNACTDVFCHIDADFCSASPAVQAKMMDNIRSIIRRRMHSTGTDPELAQPHNDRGSLDEDLVDYIMEEIMDQPDNSSNRLRSVVSATEGSM